MEIKQLLPFKISESIEDNCLKVEAINIERTPQKLNVITECCRESSAEIQTGNLSLTKTEPEISNLSSSQILSNLTQLESLKLCVAPKSVPPKLVNKKDFSSLRNFDKTQSFLCCNTDTFCPISSKSDSCSSSISPPAKRCRVAPYDVEKKTSNVISANEVVENADVCQNEIEHSMKSVELLAVPKCHSKAIEVTMVKIFFGFSILKNEI